MLCLYIMVAMSTSQRSEPAQDSMETALLGSGYYLLSNTHKRAILAGAEQLAAQSTEGGGNGARKFTGKEDVRKR
jgi:hypothetical protein